jgi:uncharacterized damage-inducible protein DinB
MDTSSGRDAGRGQEVRGVNEQLQQRFDRLEGARRQVLAHLEGHDRGELNRPRADGGWSALQVLHHVITAEAGTLRYISKKMQGGTSLPRVGVLSRLRRLGLQAAMISRLRFKAPAVAAEVPDEIDPEELRARWNEVRTGWKTLLEAFPEETLDRMVFRHVLVGLMGLPDTLAFLQSHLEHHGRQVERVLGSG